MVVPRKKKQERRKHLKGFARIGRSEEGNPFARVEHTTLDFFEWIDREKKWGFYNTPLEKVEQNLGVRISRIIGANIKRLGGKRTFSVLDAGCGSGRALADIKEKFGSKVRTVGIVVKKMPGHSYEGVDRIIEGNFNNAKFNEKFDLIFSHYGAHFHTMLLRTALEKTIELLRPGGTAVIHLSEKKFIDRNMINTVLRVNGIKHGNLKDGVLIFRKPVRKLP
jgi:SAM-dependent methyltransferase